MFINCPSCKSQVSLADESAAVALCESCGSSFSTREEGEDISVVNRRPESDYAGEPSDPTAQYRLFDSPSVAASPTPTPASPANIVTPTLAESQLAARQSIGPYNLVKCVGRGGFGLVFLAEHSLHKRREAVKVPLREKFQSDAAMREFLHEAQVAVQLDHAHIVPVYHADFADDGTPFIAMKYIDGPTLANVLNGNQRSLPQVVRLMIDVADALRYAHALGFVHRDLKPGNILIDQAGKAWVSDFGLALHSSEQLKVRGDAAGTLRYSSPEQVRGHSEHMDGRTDIYSFGVILYEVLTGGPLFVGSRNEITDQILRRPPVPPSQRDLRNEVPADLEALCLLCLEKEVSKRPSNMSVVAKSLYNWLSAEAPQLCGDLSERRRYEDGNATSPANDGNNGGGRRTDRATAVGGDPDAGGRRASSSHDGWHHEALTARTLAIAASSAEAQEADLTTSPKASADTERTVQAAPAKAATRPKVAMLSTVSAVLILLLLAAGILARKKVPSDSPPLMDVRSVPRVPVRLLHADVFNPLPIVMPPREANFEKIYNAAQETLKLESPAICAIAVGRVENVPDWQLDVSLSQAAPSGSCGACWGFQPVPQGSLETEQIGDGEFWRLQIIWLDRHVPNYVVLQRRVEYFRRIGHQFQCAGSIGLGGFPVSLAPRARQELSLVFRGPQLAKVLWNGDLVALDDLNLESVGELAKSMGTTNSLPNTGPFGVISSFGATTFERVEFHNLGAASP